MSATHHYPVLRLRPKEDRRLRAGHLWIYSNEIDVTKTPLHGMIPGSVCRIEDAQGKAIGLAHINPHTLLCGRLLSRDPHLLIDEAFYQERLHQAEGLEDRVEVLFGQVPERLQIWENDCLFEMDPRGGQKTGWFYDHRANRRRLLSYAPGRRVLDCFAYLGAFSIPLAKAGALEVTAVDSSAPALALLEENARRNAVAPIRIMHDDAMETLARLRDRGEQFDLIVLDPPALIKSKKDFKEGSIAYRRFNDLAMRLLAPGGILFTASCSHHLNRETLLGQIAFGAQRGDYAIIGEGTQDMDHPIHPAVPESSYLKGFYIHRRELIADEPE